MEFLCCQTAHCMLNMNPRTSARKGLQLASNDFQCTLQLRNERCLLKRSENSSSFFIARCSWSLLVQSCQASRSAADGLFGLFGLSVLELVAFKVRVSHFLTSPKHQEARCSNPKMSWPNVETFALSYGSVSYATFGNVVYFCHLLRNSILDCVDTRAHAVFTCLPSCLLLQKPLKTHAKWWSIREPVVVCLQGKRRQLAKFDSSFGKLPA